MDYSSTADDDEFGGDPHYSTLDDMRIGIPEPPSIISTLPEVSTITAGGAEYAAPRDRPATENPYAVPRDPKVSPDYQTPRDVKAEDCGIDKPDSDSSELTPTVMTAGAGRSRICYSSSSSLSSVYHDYHHHHHHHHYHLFIMIIITIIIIINIMFIMIIITIIIIIIIICLS